MLSRALTEQREQTAQAAVSATQHDGHASSSTEIFSDATTNRSFPLTNVTFSDTELVVVGDGPTRTLSTRLRDENAKPPRRSPNGSIKSTRSAKSILLRLGGRFEGLRIVNPDPASPDDPANPFSDDEEEDESPSPEFKSPSQSPTEAAFDEADTLSDGEPKILKMGDVLFLMTVPAGYHVGIDHHVSKAALASGRGSKLEGYWKIPGGTHLVWVADPTSANRYGYWFHVRDHPAMVHVKQWNRYNETLTEPGTLYDKREFEENADEYAEKLDAFPYTETGWRLWQRIASSITPDVLKRLTKLDNVTEWPVDTQSTSVADLTERFELYSNSPVPTRRPVLSESELHFTFERAIPTNRGHGIKSASEAATGNPLETTDAVLEVLKNGVHETDLVGELQYVWLTGTALTNLSCAEQWMYLTSKVIFRAHRLVAKKPSLVRRWLETIYWQMRYNEDMLEFTGGEVNETTVTPGIFHICADKMHELRASMAEFKTQLERFLVRKGRHLTPRQRLVGDAWQQLEALCFKRGWDLKEQVYAKAAGPPSGLDSGSHFARQDEDDGDDGDDEDYEPVVVELDEDGREVGLVSFNDPNNDPM